MESTRIISGGGDTTQRIPAGGAPPVFDPQRTAMAGPPGGLAFTAIAENSFALHSDPGRLNLLFHVQSSGALGGRRLPLNLCLVIDRSGSMEGEPLEYVKRACSYVVDLLEPADILSIVTFEEQVDVVMPARRIVNKALIKEHIQRIQPGNTTNLYDGIVAGA
jgi:Ca-activated chloride channel homolog